MKEGTKMNEFFELREPQIDYFKSPLNAQDMDWLIHIWHMSKKSRGMDAIIEMDNIPRKLMETTVYRHLYERLTYYRDIERMIVDFEEWEDEGAYYIYLADGFLDAVNRYIRINFPKYKQLTPYGE